MFADFKNDWLYNDASGNYTIALASSASGTVNGNPIDLQDAHYLTNALVLIPALTGGDSPAFALQQSDDTVSGHFTTLGDANASVTATTGTGVVVLTGQRTKRYGRITVTPSTAADVVTAYGVLFGFQKLSPLGAKGTTRSPA